MSDAPASSVATSSVGSPLASVDRALSRLRLIIAGALLLPYLAQPASTRGDLVPLAMVLGVGVAMVATNLITKSTARSEGARFGWLASVVILTVDSAATVVIVSRLDVLDEQVVWALLVIPVLEGALRFRMLGAMLTWLGVSAAYLALHLSVPGVFADPETHVAFLEQIQTLLYRVGIVLLVAVPGGYLSEQLLQAIAAQRAQQKVAASRSALLVEVVEAGRRLTELGTDFRTTMVEAALNLGFDVVEFHGQTGDEVEVTARSRAFGGVSPALHHIPIVADAADQASNGNQVVIVGGSDDDPEYRRQVQSAGFGAVVLCPIVASQGAATGLLTAATRIGVEPKQHEVECLELLAGQANVAVDNDALVTSLHQVQGRLHHQANHDVLTGLPNRMMFQRRLEASLDALRGGESKGFCLLFLDLDRFKEVNDSLGHEAGDELLVAVAGRLRNAVRQDDLVARLGGDEFILLLPEATDVAASRVADELSSRLNRPFRIQSETVSISASIGIVAAGEPISGVELLRRVDAAMYQAKNRGRATWQVHSPELDADTQRRAEMKRELHKALANGEIEAAFQPIVSMHTNRIEAVEVLARWNHAEGGSVRPDLFIEVAENSGLINQLGAQMLLEGCRRGRQLRDLNPAADLSVAVNISPHQARRDGFARQVLDTLERTHLEPDRLIVELTERVLVADEVFSTLAELRGHGIKIAVDDFGQGHTSIGSLGRLPADSLKIDQAFVREARVDPARSAILRSMIRIGHDLSMRVIAEGVESTHDLEFLRTLGCDAVQGYLLHRPMPFEEVVTAIAEHDPAQHYLEQSAAI